MEEKLYKKGLEKYSLLSAIRQTLFLVAFIRMYLIKGIKYGK
jgi:hypothetical protein